jgi:NADH:ubiquinone oxidoreductase subunit 3 (subunit A)
VKNPYTLLAIIFLCLGVPALYLAPQALHRGNRGLSFILIIMALIFFSRLQGKRS